MPDYSVVIPFHNEVQSCRFVIEELKPVLEAVAGTAEVVAVDDGSMDGTLDVLRQLASEWPAVRVVALGTNQGQGPALLAGLVSAAGETIITMDGDGQNVAADIPRLLTRLDDTDMVAGIRKSRDDSWLRRHMSRTANAIRGRILGDHMQDSGCALKVFRRDVVSAFLPLRTLYSFMPALAVAAGFRVIQVAVHHRPRTGGRSHYGLRVMLWRPALDMVGLWWWRHRRFRMPTLPS